MQVGDLVMHKKHFGDKILGVITAIGSPVPIARILWADGKVSDTRCKRVEAV